MSTAIDSAQTPYEYLSPGEYDHGPHRTATVTVEVLELRKLMRIAGAAYEYLHKDAPESVLSEACDDYSVFCGMIPKKNRIKSLERLEAAIRDKKALCEVKRRCDEVFDVYARAMGKLSMEERDNG